MPTKDSLNDQISELRRQNLAQEDVPSPLGVRRLSSLQADPIQAHTDVDTILREIDQEKKNQDEQLDRDIQEHFWQAAKEGFDDFDDFGDESDDASMGDTDAAEILMKGEMYQPLREELRQLKLIEDNPYYSAREKARLREKIQADIRRKTRRHRAEAQAAAAVAEAKRLSQMKAQLHQTQSRNGFDALAHDAGAAGMERDDALHPNRAGGYGDVYGAGYGSGYGSDYGSDYGAHSAAFDDASVSLDARGRRRAHAFALGDSGQNASGLSKRRRVILWVLSILLALNCLFLSVLYIFRGFYMGTSLRQTIDHIDPGMTTVRVVENGQIVRHTLAEVFYGYFQLGSQLDLNQVISAFWQAGFRDFSYDYMTMLRDDLKNGTNTAINSGEALLWKYLGDRRESVASRLGQSLYSGAYVNILNALNPVYLIGWNWKTRYAAQLAWLEYGWFWEPAERWGRQIGTALAFFWILLIGLLARRRISFFIRRLGAAITIVGFVLLGFYLALQWITYLEIADWYLDLLSIEMLRLMIEVQVRSLGIATLVLGMILTHIGFLTSWAKRRFFYEKERLDRRVGF